MSQAVRPRETQKFSSGIHRIAVYLFAMRLEHGGDKGDKTLALWGGDCTTSDWMIDGSGRSNQGLSASTVCLSGLVEGVSACLAQRGTHLDYMFLLDKE